MRSSVTARSVSAAGSGSVKVPFIGDDVEALAVAAEVDGSKSE
jgi:hypothetical protein